MATWTWLSVRATVENATLGDDDDGRVDPTKSRMTATITKTIPARAPPWRMKYRLEAPKSWAFSVSNSLSESTPLSCRSASLDNFDATLSSILGLPFEL